MLPIRQSLLAVLALATMVASCGGKVAVDAPSGQGGQAGGGVPSQAGALCAMRCDALAAAGCPLPHQDQCAAGCVTAVGYEGTCASAAVALLECWLKVSPDQLCATKGCEEEQAQLRACTHPPGGCSTNQCVVGVGGSHCTTTCGDNVYETTCAVSPPSYPCTCVLNGATVGTCTDALSASAACCDGIFASQ